MQRTGLPPRVAHSGPSTPDVTRTQRARIRVFSMSDLGMTVSPRCPKVTLPFHPESLALRVAEPKVPPVLVELGQKQLHDSGKHRPPLPPPTPQNQNPYKPRAKCSKTSPKTSKPQHLQTP